MRDRVTPLARWAMAAAVLVALVPAGPASATGTDHPVSMILGNAFSPATVTSLVGVDTVTWTNTAAVTHTSAQDGPFKLWNTGNVLPATSAAPVSTVFAGAFPYHCNIHAGMTGKVRVALDIDDLGGGNYQVQIASVTPPVGQVMDLQRKVGSGQWKDFRVGTKEQTFQLTPGTGTYRFRAHLRVKKSGKTSGWSPIATLIV